MQPTDSMRTSSKFQHNSQIFRRQFLASHGTTTKKTRNRIVKITLNNERTSESITMAKYKWYHRVVVIKNHGNQL